jgi:membrane protease YdiL (CAAX protease family)
MTVAAPEITTAAPEITTAAPEITTKPRVPAVVATGIVVAALVSVNFAEHLLRGAEWLGPVAAVALLVFARWSGLSWSQLGLHHSRLRSGMRWGLGAIALVAAVYLVGVFIPLTRPAFLDARYHLGLHGALVSAFVIIPVSTILLEEVAFRSVLWGMLARHVTTWRVLLTSSALFGLWHILPSLHLAAANHGVGDAVRGAGTAASVLVIVGIVAFTALGGVVAGELRRRSGSVLASAGMHWATNSLGVLFGLLAWRMAG